MLMQTLKIPAALPTLLKSLGINIAELSRRGGLPAALWNSGEDITVTTSQMFTLWRVLGEITPDPGIALKFVAKLPQEQHHPASIVAQHSKNFREAIQRFARYKLLCCSEELQVIESTTECRVAFDWLFAEEPPPPLLLDAAFASLFELGRRGTQQALHPLYVEYQHAGSTHGMHEAHFGCPVKFCSKHNAIVFRARDLDLPFVTYNAELVAMLAPQLDREIASVQKLDSTSSRVKWVVKRMLVGGLPDIGQVARELGLSSRTLQRRITDEGTSYRRLIGDARHELARQYLRQRSLEFGETACLLGYEDPNSFFRAFRNWEGTTPGEWRAAQNS